MGRYEVEARVWKLISGLLKDPEKIRLGMNKKIEEEWTKRVSDPEREARTWTEKLAESDRLRAAYQDQQAAGHVTLEELGGKLEELEAMRNPARAEIAHLLEHKE